LSKFPHAEELITNAKKIVADGKGILAADESVGTFGKRLEAIGLENNAENRGEWREIMFRTEGFEKYIGGVILFEEQLMQKSSEGHDLIDYLKKKDVVIGIKVDKGVKNLFGTEGETVTIGIDDLDTRCKKFYEKGARFAKWRAVLDIKGGSIPSENAIQQNAYTLARYASICQENRLVPIIEPEVLMDGDHDIYTAALVTRRVLAAVYYQCHLQNVLLEGTLLKPNMVLPGFKYSDRKSVSSIEIGRNTIRVLQNCVPPSVAGIVFLSGGQSEEEATVNLNACNLVKGEKPWKVSFSYGRALQKSGLNAWKGKKENTKAAQEAWLTRAKANWEAAQGKYTGGAASSSSTESLHIENYVY